jgi:hypothetical protein
MIGESTRKTLALLTLTYCEYAMEKPSGFQLHWRFKEGREDSKMTKEVGSQTRKGQM